MPDSKMEPKSKRANSLTTVVEWVFSSLAEKWYFADKKVSLSPTFYFMFETPQLSTQFSQPQMFKEQHTGHSEYA